MSTAHPAAAVGPLGRPRFRVVEAYPAPSCFDPDRTVTAYETLATAHTLAWAHRLADRLARGLKERGLLDGAVFVEGTTDEARAALARESEQLWEGLAPDDADFPF